MATETRAQGREEQAMERLRERTSAISTLSCSFTQETDIPLFTAPVVSQGTLRFKKPDMIAWEYTAPAAEGFVLTGDKGYRWQESRAKRIPFTTASDPLAGLVGRQVLSWICFDQQWINSEYGIAVDSLEPLAFTLTPKRKDVRAVVECLKITFASDGVAESVVLREKSGGTTTIRFHNVVLNAPFERREFQ